MKKETSREEKIKKLKEALPLFWNSYQHMHNARVGNYKNTINFLLIVATFLPLLSATLYQVQFFHNYFVLLPIPIQILAIFILLGASYLSPGIHWFELDKTLLDLKKNEFEIKLISDLKKLEGITWNFMVESGRIIGIAKCLIYLSLFGLFLSSIFILFNGGLLIYCLILLLIGFLAFCKLYYKLKKFEKTDLKSKDYFTPLKDWVNGKEIEREKKEKGGKKVWDGEK